MYLFLCNFIEIFQFEQYFCWAKDIILFNFNNYNPLYPNFVTQFVHVTFKYGSGIWWQFAGRRVIELSSATLVWRTPVMHDTDIFLGCPSKIIPILLAHINFLSLYSSMSLCQLITDNTIHKYCTKLTCMSSEIN